MSVSWPGPGFIDFSNGTFLPHTQLPLLNSQLINPPHNNVPITTDHVTFVLTNLDKFSKVFPRSNPQPRSTTKQPHKKTTTKRPPRRTRIPRFTTKRPHPTPTKPHKPRPTTTTKKPHHPRPTTHKPRPTKTTHRTTHHPPKTTAKQDDETTPPPTATDVLTPITTDGSASNTTQGSNVYTVDMTSDDATWILINSFLIFTMQTGFGLLEAGVVAEKNVVNIMMKNVVDIVLGGLTYWVFGFSLSYGADPGSNGFAGVGEYVVDTNDYNLLGPVMVQYIFQLSFATTSTTIVSGAVAERCNFKAYCLFSLINVIIYSVPCKWIWGYGGWLGNLGCIDIAGSGAVHLLGGVSAYVAAWMLGPRLGRYDYGPGPLPLGDPFKCIFGMFILWWGWLSFNCGSTFGITGDLWKFAARAAVTTMQASFAGGIMGGLYTFIFKKFFDVMVIINAILGALVGITAGCALYHTFDALIIGIIGGIVSIVTAGFADWTRVDDVVGATSVHGFCGIWGMIAVGLFAEDDRGAGFSKGNAGVFRGGTFYLLWIQLLACASIIAWGTVTTVILFFAINLIVPIRMQPYEELLGADFTEHGIRKRFIGITPAVSILGSKTEVQEVVKESVVVGYTNPTHDAILQAFDEINGRKRWKNYPGGENFYEKLREANYQPFHPYYLSIPAATYQSVKKIMSQWKKTGIRGKTTPAREPTIMTQSMEYGTTDGLVNDPAKKHAEEIAMTSTTKSTSWFKRRYFPCCS